MTPVICVKGGASPFVVSPCLVPAVVVTEILIGSSMSRTGGIIRCEEDKNVILGDPSSKIIRLTRIIHVGAYIRVMSMSVRSPTSCRRRLSLGL